ncbi:related to gamma-glutamyltransferase [Melanopsichium pennsylvanicum]|uniref:Glutathione hydrolase n=2 Tax=Melanopsichium pennsylvanicum TaxID=63383 RepID=A0AAJ4XKP5_9BASI|nr:related to gamma-glutamyltransferase [Melanopsichium pennsylvanicum 4]SNX83561.1 related to gamma-glutamyltransferase [Melanopsichium pennsylvanicum]
MASKQPHRPSSLRSSTKSESGSIDPIQEEVVSKDGRLSAPSPLPTETSPLLPQTQHRHSSKPRKSKSVCNSILVLMAIFTFAIVTSIILKNLVGEFDDPITTPPSTDPRGRRHPAVLATGKSAGVATENEICSKIGLRVLKEHGTAVDAAVASTLCVGVLNMFSSGIGGGGFMIVRDPSPCFSHPKHSHDCAQHITIDFRETAPAAANKTMYVGRVPKAQFGGLAVGVPGELRGLEEAHKRWGKLPWKRLVMPSVELAKSAVVSKELARRLSYFGGFMLEDPTWSEIFVDEATGELKKAGDVFHRKAYAKTLQTIAEKGAEAFYSGSIATSLVETTQSHGGILTLDDMAGYKVVVRKALQGSWLGKKIFTTHAPTSGPILLSILNQLSLIPDFLTNPEPSSLNLHRFVETLKFGFGQRTELADPAYMDVEGNTRIAEIPTMAEAQSIVPNISDDKTHPLEYYHPKFDIISDHGTMHLSILDKDGMAIALTSTVNLIFGSRVMDAKTGVILNDEMDDTSTPGVPNAFGLAPSPYNYPEAGKRPLSSTCPTIIENAETGEVEMILGGSGGSRIFSSVLQTIFNFVLWRMDLSQAIEAPRLHHQLLPTQLSVETGYSNKTLAGLLGRGHEVSWIDIDLGIAEVQAVAVGGGTGRHKKVWAASDSRKGGVAVAI